MACGASARRRIAIAAGARSLKNAFEVCDIRNRNYHYTVVGKAQSTEAAMKMLFLATAACLVFSLSSSAQAQKAKFSDQYCVPYCANYCAKFCANPGRAQECPSKCPPKCLTMCRELGH